MKIVMTAAEVDLLTAFMKQCDHYFEYGMGGSTCLAAKLIGKSLTSIDSDPAWINKVKENIGDSNLEMSFKHIDIGKTGNWGTPIGTESEEKFPSYSKAIRDANTESIDFCLIDGRFRVACFLEALLSLRSDAIIAIHDYAERRHYHVVENFARPIASAQQLFFFVRKPGIPDSEIEKMAETYRYNYK